MQERGYQDEDRQNRRDFSDRDRNRRDFDERTFGRNDRMNRGDRDLDRWGDQSDQSLYSGRSYDRDDDNRNLSNYGSQQRFAPFDRDRGMGSGSSYEIQQGNRDFDRDDRQRNRQQSMGLHTGRGPKGYQRSDERIREDVCDCLTRDPQVDASEIEVQVKDGEVTLTGTVSNRNEKRCAEDAIDDVSGVKEIHNQIRVQPHQQESMQHGMQNPSQQGKQQGAAQKGSQF